MTRTDRNRQSALPCRKNQLVFVRWEDTVRDRGPWRADEPPRLQPAVNVNVGWIIEQDDKVVRLANGISNTQEVDYIDILQANVLEIVPILKPRRRPK